MKRRSRSISIPRRHRSRLLRTERLEDRRLLAVTPGWAFQLEGANKEFVDDMSVGADGSTYLAGRYWGTMDFDPGPGTDSATQLGGGDAFIAKYTPSGQLAWAQTMTSANDGVEQIWATNVDASGNVYIAGNFDAASANLGPFSISTQGSNDAFAAKLDSQGNVLWLRSWGSTGGQAGRSITADSDGNVLIGGKFSQTVDFDADPDVNNVHNVSSQGGQDGFLLKLDSNGDFLSVSTVGGTATDVIHWIEADGAGNVYAAGWFEGDGQYGTSDGTTPVELSSTGDRENFVMKVDTDGYTEWIHPTTGNASTIDDMQLDGLGNLYVAGNNSSAFGFGPNTLGTAGAGTYIAKWNTNGVLDWTGQVNDATVSRLGFDNDGNPHLGGFFQGTTDFDPGPGTHELTTPGNVSTFALKLDSSGGFDWVETIDHLDGLSNWYARPIGADAAGNVYLGAGFGNGNGVPSEFPTGDSFSSVGFEDAYVLKLANADTPPVEILADSFESGQWNGLWVEDSQNDWFTSTQRSTDGNSSAEVDGKATDATLTVAGPIDMSAYGSADLSFDWYIESGFDNGESLKLELFDGVSWNEIRSLDGNVDQENTWHNEIVRLQPQYLISDFQFRFSAKVSRSNEDANLDNVRLLATSLAGPPNQDPIADPGSAQSGNEDNLLTFDASRSSDPDGDPLTYSWAFGDGQTAVTSSPTVSHAYEYGGTFDVTVTVDDGRGGDSQAMTTATVTETNDDPVASAGGPYSGFKGASITFDASGSTDFDNLDGTTANDQILEYTWDFGDETGAITTDGTVDHTYAEADTYVVRLSVSDGISSSPEDVTTALVDSVPTNDPNTLYVYDIRFDSKRGGRDWRAVFEIRSDSNADGAGSSEDNVASGVSITVEFAGKTYTGTTDSNGVFRTSWQRKLSSGDHYANAVDLALTGYSWSPLDLDLEDDTDNDGLPDALLAL